MIWQQLIIWVVSFLLSDYFRERLPAQTASGLGDFNIPTATEGRVVPIIPGGSMRIEAPNCIWYGDFAAIERTVTTGVVFKKDETIGFTYLLAFQYALCKVPLAGLTGVWIGDDQVFDYIVDNGGLPATVVDIEREDLFGGEDDGGGFIARIRLFNGTETQAVSPFLNSRIDPLPAYRGTAYIMVTDLTETVGANIGESNSLRYLRVSVQAFDTIANGGLGDSLGTLNDEHFIGEDANPIAVAFDLYTNTRWGRSFPPSDMDLPSFQAAHATCFTEGIGFSQVIDEQTTTGEIQDTLEQHIDGYIGPNPVTGRIEVTLARQDYVPASEFQATAVNIQSIKKWSKGDWSQTFNRIRIRYSDRAKQWNESHAIELAPGNLIIQGGRTKTKELRFQGVHTAAVASLMAARTRRQNAQPIASGTIELDRTAYQLRPGSIIVLTSEQISETNLATRVTKAGVGNVEQNTMEFEVVSDVFDQDTATVSVPPPTDFVPPIQVVIPFGVLDQAAFETPFILMRFDATANAVPRITTLAFRNLGNTPTEYEVIRRVRNPPASFGGAYTSTDFVTGGFCQVGTLRNNEIGWTAGNGGFQIQIDPVLGSLDGLIGTYSPTTGGGGTGNAAGICVISPGLPDEEFIVTQEIVDDLGGIRLEQVWRGCMDTPRKAHVIGAQVWFIWTGGMGMGPEIYNVGDGVDMKFLPRSPTDALTEPEATSLPEVLLDEDAGVRNSKPLLPYNLALNSTIVPESTDEIDFETIHTSPAFTGVRGLPALRDWRNQAILGSIIGLDLLQTGFNPDDVIADEHALQWFIHNLDTDPTANRANAVADSGGFDAQSTNADPFDIPKSDLVASGVQGFAFNARIEIEMFTNPVAQTQAQVSHDTMEMDFIAVGIFSVLVSDVVLQSHFDGVDTDTFADEVGPSNTFLEFVGAAQIDTAESVFGGASLLLDGVDSYVRTTMPPAFDINDEWTIELRIRFTADPASSVEFIGQMDGLSRNSWTFAYTGTGNRFEMGTSSNGTAGPNFIALHTGTFIPVAGTQYALAICKEPPPGNTIHLFIDGAQVGGTVVQGAVSFNSSQDLIIGARHFSGVPIAFFDGHFDELRLTPKCLYRANYTIDTVAFDDSRRNYPLLAHFDAGDGATAYTDESLFANVLTFGAATTQIDTAQSMFGGSSLLMTGVNGTGPTGTGDGILVPYTAGQNLGRGVWVMELFVRFNALPNGDGSMLLSKYHRSNTAVDWLWYVNTDLSVTFIHTPNGNVVNQNFDTSPVQTIVVDTWYHFAAQRRGDDLELYFNGNRILLEVDAFLDGSGYVGSLNQPDRATSSMCIGSAHNVSVATRYRAMDGWHDEPRFVHGLLPYNGSTYTVPAQAFTDPRMALTLADRNPYIFLSGWENTDGFATDNVMRSEDLIGALFIFINQAQIDTANFKFGTSSLLVDGNADGVAIHLSRSVHDLADNDFTMDCWADPDILPEDSGSGGMALLSQWDGPNNDRQWKFWLRDTGTSSDLVFSWSVDGTVIKNAFVLDYVPTVDVFEHFEVSRAGATLRIFIGGVLQTLDGASDAITTDVIHQPVDDAANEIWVGLVNDTAGSDNDFDGHIDEVRIVNFNDHTATFTPMVVPYTRPSLPDF